MADIIRIKDVETEATSIEDYDYLVIDSSNKGTRKIRKDILSRFFGGVPFKKQEVTTFDVSVQVANDTTFLVLISNVIVPTVSIVLPAAPTAQQVITIVFGNNVSKTEDDVFTNNFIGITATQPLFDILSPAGTVMYHREVLQYQFLDNAWRRI